MLEWFLLIIYCYYIVFLIKERKFADAQYWTVTLSNWKSSHGRFSIKTLFLKILYYSHGNTYVKFLWTPFLKNWLYEVAVWNFAFLSHLKPSQLINITVAFRALNEIWCIYSLYNYITPMLSCELRFAMFVINGYYTQIKRLQSLNSLF